MSLKASAQLYMLRGARDGGAMSNHVTFFYIPTSSTKGSPEAFKVRKAQTVCADHRAGNNLGSPICGSSELCKVMLHRKISAMYSTAFEKF